jgi:hypothetical protein
MLIEACSQDQEYLDKMCLPLSMLASIDPQAGTVPGRRQAARRGCPGGGGRAEPPSIASSSVVQGLLASS